MFKIVKKWLNKRRTFNDEDRLKSQETRAINKLRKVKLQILTERVESLRRRHDEQRLTQELEELEDEMLPPEEEERDDNNIHQQTQEDNPDQMITQLIMSAFSAQKAKPKETDGVPRTTYTDEEIRKFKKSIPKPQLILIKSLSDDKLEDLILSRIPNVDSDTVARAKVILRGK